MRGPHAPPPPSLPVRPAPRASLTQASLSAGLVCPEVRISQRVGALRRRSQNSRAFVYAVGSASKAHPTPFPVPAASAPSCLLSANFMWCEVGEEESTSLQNGASGGAAALLSFALHFSSGNGAGERPCWASFLLWFVHMSEGDSGEGSSAAGARRLHPLLCLGQNPGTVQGAVADRPRVCLQRAPGQAESAHAAFHGPGDSALSEGCMPIKLQGTPRLTPGSLFFGGKG